MQTPDEPNEKSKFAEPLDYRTQNLGFSTFSTDPNSKSVNFQTAAAQAVQYSVGDIVGLSYCLLDQVGQGGMGVVYLAEHIIFKQKYALKLLAPNQITETNWARFEIEGRGLGAHRSSQHCQNLQYGHRSTMAVPFYVMDWLPARHCWTGWSEKGSASRKCFIFTLKSVPGLGSAHKNGIVHRDVKPSQRQCSAPL